MHLLARHSKSSRSRPRRNCSNPRCLARRTGCAMPESYRRPAAGLPRPFGNSSQNREAPAHWPAAPDDAPPIRPAPRRSGRRDPRSIKSKGESCTPTRIPNPPQDKRFFGFSMTQGIVTIFHYPAPQQASLELTWILFALLLAGIKLLRKILAEEKQPRYLIAR